VPNDAARDLDKPVTYSYVTFRTSLRFGFSCLGDHNLDIGYRRAAEAALQVEEGIVRGVEHRRASKTDRPADLPAKTSCFQTIDFAARARGLADEEREPTVG
jgi:hypothetical protein